MSWAKFDDRYDDNRKIKRAWRRHPRAVGLHAMAITYCARHRTDGIVDIEWLEERVPSTRERVAVIGALVDCGLFEPVDGEHWYVHDFLEYNPSSEQREALSRGAKAAALARWGKRLANDNQGGAASAPHSDPLCDPHSEPHAQPNATPHPLPLPDPKAAAARARAPAREAEPDLTSPALDHRLAPIVDILQAATDPDGQSLMVEPASVDSALKAFPDVDAASVAHEVASWVAEGTARTFHAATLLRAALRRRDHRERINAGPSREHPADARDRDLAAMAARFAAEDDEA